MGDWDTDIELANMNPAVVKGTIFKLAMLPLAPCPPNCATASTPFVLPPNGTLVIRASEFLGTGFPTFPGPQIIRVTTDSEAPLPVVHARVLNKSNPSQTAELPVFRESTIQSLDTSVLVFPGATGMPGVHSNLFLEVLGIDKTGASVLVEVFSPEGQLLASGDLNVTNEFGPGAMIVDVVGALGAPSIDGGQVRVTKTEGDAVIWGVLSTVYDDGRLAVAVGANP